MAIINHPLADRQHKYATAPSPHSVSLHNCLSKVCHYNDVIMAAIASQITSLTIVYLTVYPRCRSKKTSKLRVTGLCEGNSPVNSPHKGPVTRKIFPFDDVIMFPILYGGMYGGNELSVFSLGLNKDICDTYIASCGGVLCEFAI